jgi:hypothetical protein
MLYSDIQNTSPIKTEYSGKILKIKVTGLKDLIYVTPEHKLFTTEKDFKSKRNPNEFGQNRLIPNSLIFKEAKFFKKGQCLLIPVNTEIIDIDSIKIERNIKQSKYSNHNIYDGIPNEINIDFDLLNTLGWFIAEGSANNKQFQFIMHKKELPYANIIVNSIYNMFSKKPAIKIVGENSIKIVGNSKVLSLFFNDLCGKYAENKRIPDFIMKLPIEKQIILLTSLWKGDGCIYNKYDIRTKKSYINCKYKTVSLTLAKQIQELCFRLGFICSLKQEKNIKPKIIHNNKKETVPQDAYSVYMNGQDAINFNHLINYGELIKIKRRNNKQLSLSKDFVKIENCTYVKRSIIDIQEISYEYVFNLPNSYIANDIAIKGSSEIS